MAKTNRYFVTERTIDPIQTIYYVLVALLVIGVIPFTHVGVGLILLAGGFELKMRF